MWLCWHASAPLSTSVAAGDVGGAAPHASTDREAGYVALRRHPEPAARWCACKGVRISRARTAGDRKMREHSSQGGLIGAFSEAV